MPSPPSSSGNLQGMRPFVLALPVAVLLAGCSGSSGSAAPSPSPSSAAPTLEPTAEATTPAPDPTGTATPTAGGSPTRTSTRPAADGDVDGDGRKDAVSTTATVITVTLSGSGRKLTAPIHADDPRPAQVRGSHDVDRDGRAEVFVQTAQGASAFFVTPYRYDGTKLVELQVDGEPARFGIGGAVTYGNGFVCLPDGHVDVKESESTDGETYTITDRLYRVAGARLVLVRTATSKARQGSAPMMASYSADCGSVGEGR
jgi:hypothetical protein